MYALVCNIRIRIHLLNQKQQSDKTMNRYHYITFTRALSVCLMSKGQPYKGLRARRRAVLLPMELFLINQSINFRLLVKADKYRPTQLFPFWLKQCPKKMQCQCVGKVTKKKHNNLTI